MEEVQSWWEVPAVAHFCYVFREVFNLFYLEIGELEAAILNIQDPEMCISLEQLITRLLQGCYESEFVTTENWKDKLTELFEKNCEDEETPLTNTQSFYSLTSRNKVEILMKLCEFRLDADRALEAIKDIPPEDMQAKCIGKDSHNNSYWYFCDERLYMEKTSDMKKNTTHTTSKKSKNIITNGKCHSSRGRKEKNHINNSHSDTWSIACYNVSDWEKLAKTFSKSKKSEEKELSNIIKSEYLNFLQEVVSEKDALLRKRFLELAPKRTSSRISKVQALKKLEEQKAFEAAEKARIEYAEEQEKKEVERKKLKKEERQKRAEERCKAIEERALRAESRKLINFISDDSLDKGTETQRKGGKQVQTDLKKRKREHSSSEESESDDESDHAELRESGSDDKESDSDESDSENEYESLSNSKPIYSKNFSQTIASKTVLVNKINGTQCVKQNIQSDCNSTRWTSTIDSKGRKTLIFKDPSQCVANKKEYENSTSSPSENVKEIKTYYKVPSPYKQSTFITYGKITPSPSIIRLNYVK